MSSKRTYFVDSTEVSIASTSPVPALYGSAPSTADFNIVGIRVSCEAVSSPAPASNGSILATIAQVTGTAAGGSAVTPQQKGGNVLAARSSWLTAASSPITGLTKGSTLWSHPIAFAGGASWGEWFPDGFEIPDAPSGLIAVYFTAASGYGSGCAFKVTAEIAE